MPLSASLLLKKWAQGHVPAPEPARTELAGVLEIMVKKSASGSGQPSVFSEITDDDIDNDKLFAD